MLHHVYQRVVCKDKFQHTLPLFIEKKKDLTIQQRRTPESDKCSHVRRCISDHIEVCLRDEAKNLGNGMDLS